MFCLVTQKITIGKKKMHYMLILQYVQLLVRIQNLIRNGNKQVKRKSNQSLCTCLVTEKMFGKQRIEIRNKFFFKDSLEYQAKIKVKINN